MTGAKRHASSASNPWESNQVCGATFVIGVEATNIINLGIQLLGPDMKDLAVRGAVHFYWSDSATGDDIVATAPSSGTAIGTDGLAIEYVADKAMLLISEVDGDIDINISEAGVKTLYGNIVLPSGEIKTSGPITFA